MAFCNNLATSKKYKQSAIPVPYDAQDGQKRVILNPGVLRYSTKVGMPDGRLIHPAYGPVPQQFDRPPFSASMPLDAIFSSTELDNYGKRYTDYTSVNAGNVLYYTSPDQSKPFFQPNYSTPTEVDNFLYIDPMSNPRLQHQRKPVEVTRNCSAIGYGQCPAIPGAPLPPFDSGCLSWITDSGEHRQDLMALQQRPRLEENWQMAQATSNSKTSSNERSRSSGPQPVIYGFRL